MSEAIVNHSFDGRFAIREGKWKLELCPGSGGWDKPKDVAARREGLPDIQLYNMHDDISEKVNLQDQDPEVIAHLLKLLEKYVTDGRSTPGAPQKNDVQVDIWKNNLNEMGRAKRAKK